MMQLPRVMAVMGLSLMAFTLGGCESLREVFAPDTIVYPPYEGEGLSERPPTEKELLYGRGDFSIELVHFKDERRPRSMAVTAGEDVVYEYDPDNLLQGVSYKVPVLVNKHIAWKEKQAKHYKLELQLKKLQTRVLKGNLLSGTFGRYTVDLEARAVVRRPDSRVAVNRAYKFALVEKRATSNGRSPSKELDRAREYDIAEDAFRRLAEAIAYDVRRIDSRRWDIDEEKGYGRVGPADEIEEAPEPVVGKGSDEETAQPARDLPTTVEELVGPEGVEDGKDADGIEETPVVDERPVQG